MSVDWGRVAREVALSVATAAIVALGLQLTVFSADTVLADPMAWAVGVGSAVLKAAVAAGVARLREFFTVPGE